MNPTRDVYPGEPDTTPLPRVEHPRRGVSDPAQHRHTAHLTGSYAGRMTRIALAVGLVLTLLAAAGCGVRDTRPESTYAEFEQQAAALAGVRSVTATAASTYMIDLDPQAGEADLAQTADDLFFLVNDHRYPTGAPEATVESGVFSGEIGVVRQGAPPGVPQPGPLGLAHLPFLHALPDVEAGTLSERGASVQLTEHTDMRTWATDAAASPRELRLSARRPMTADELRLLPADDRTAAGSTEDTASPDPNPAADPNAPAPEPAPEQPVVSLVLDLSRPDLPADLTRLHETADAASALLIEADLSSTLPEPDAALAVPADADIPAAYAAFAAEYGQDQLDDVRVRSAEGLSVTGGGGNIDAHFAARDLLAEAGAAVTSMDLRRGALTAEVPDGTTLRALAAATGGPAWPLPSDTRISVRNTAHPDDSPYFDADEWPSHADLLAALWENGFDAIRMSGGTQRSDFDLRIQPSDTQDLTSPDSRAALIDVLRTTGWGGKAQISLSTGGHLVFWSTEDGPAEDAYMSLHGADRKPSGWAADFLAEWDASA